MTKYIALVLTLVTSLFIQGTLSSDVLTCANCVTKTRAEISEYCSNTEIQALVPQASCEEANTGNTDADITTKVCDPLGICGDTFVSCNTCITKMRAVIEDSLCASITGGMEITFMGVVVAIIAYSSTCKTVAAAFEDSSFTACDVGSGIVGADAWGYDSCNGPSTWSTDYGYSDCAGTNQSPIDLDSSLSPGSLLTFSSEYMSDLPGAVVNDGRHLVFTFDSAPTATVTGLLLDFNTYTPVEIKYHWGSTNEQGSEHTIDDQEFAGEMQVIHRNTKYADLDDALGETDGVLIMSYLFKSEWKDHIDMFLTEMDAISKAPNQFTASQTSSINLNDYMSAVDVNGFFKYSGSLTEPDCNEDVTWIVFSKPLAVRPFQLNTFRLMKNLDGVPNANNYRPPQPLNDRTVERYEA